MCVSLPSNSRREGKEQATVSDGQIKNVDPHNKTKEPQRRCKTLPFQQRGGSFISLRDMSLRLYCGLAHTLPPNLRAREHS